MSQSQLNCNVQCTKRFVLTIKETNLNTETPLA